jgi:hypothetical protein
MDTMGRGLAERITGDQLYRATYCAHTDPLPLLPSGPGGVGGVASRRTRHKHDDTTLGPLSGSVPIRHQVADSEFEISFPLPLFHVLDQYVGLDIDRLADG